jgi:hypothetical protein
MADNLVFKLLFEVLKNSLYLCRILLFLPRN